MTTTPPVPAPLAPGWAFVVQLREGTSFEPAVLCGRVEHVASGKAGNFDSLEAMRQFMQGVLRSPNHLSTPRGSDPDETQ